MLKGIAGVVAALVVWTIVATVANLIVRLSWPAYARVETAMTFTLGMLLARLVVGALASLCAGFVVAGIAPGSRLAAGALAGVLLLVFLPVHYKLWDKFPPWYHAVFLASLVVATLLGASLRRKETS